MGCSSSNTAASTVSTRPGEGQDESRTSHDNSALLPLTESAIFIGVSPHLNVLCLDEFQSKYTEDLMYRWRPAEILKVEGDDRSKVLIRYIGWAETFDHWLDLRTDCSKLAPVNLLTKEQCTRGIALTNEQANVAREFFQHGCECTGPIELIFPSDDKIQPLTSESLAMSKLGVLPTPSEDDIIIRMPAKLPDPVIPNSAPSSNTVVAKRRTSATSTPMMVPHRSQTHEPSTSSVGLTPTAPASLVVPPIQQQQQQQSTQEIATSDNPYCVDDMVDVLDIFYKKGASVPSQKWRPAEVLEVVGDYITIHYLNWHDKYNERLHHRNDAHRLSVFGSKATRNVNSSSRGSGDSVTSTGQQSAPVFSSSSHRPRKEGNEFSNTSFIGAHKDHRINGRGFSVGELSGASESSELDRSSPPRRPSDSHSTAKIDRTSEQGSTSYPGYSAQREIEHTGNDVAGAGPSASATAQEGGDLTPEQHSFTRNFFNYRKKRDESDKKAASGVPVAVAAPAATGTTASERPEGFLRQVSMMSFTNMFGNREDNKNSDNNYKNNITGAAGPVVAVAEARAVDGGAATPTSPKSKSSTEERTQEEIAAKEQLFLEKLEAKGLHVFAIEGDGNCLFRAVSHQLYLHQDMHDELRACVVEHLIRHRKRFEVFVEGDFEEHLREMSKLGIWADDLEIRALEEITDRIIVIYSSDVENVGEEPLNNNFEERNLLKGVPPITLSYHGQSHYNSIYDERYPLPLVHRKSRLLLRSRTALSKQDHLAMAAGQVSATSDPASPPPSNQPVMFHPSANKNQPIYHHPGGYVAGYHQHHPGYPPALHPQYRHASQPQPQYQVGSASGSVSGGVNESSSVSLSRSESDDMPEIPNPHYSAPYAYYSAAQMQQAQAFALAHGQQYQTQQYYAPPPPPHMVPAAESGDSQEEDDNDFQDADNNGTNSNNSSIAYDAPQYGHPYVHPLGEAAAHYGVYMGRPAQQYGGYHYPQSSGLEYETATGAY